MGWTKNYVEEMDEYTIQNLPEPYRTWCEEQEKPLPWWKTVYRYPVYQVCRLIEKIAPKYKSHFYEEVFKGRKVLRYYKGICERWNPFTEPYDLYDVPDDIMFPAWGRAEQDLWEHLTDSAIMAVESERMKGR